MSFFIFHVFYDDLVIFIHFLVLPQKKNIFFLCVFPTRKVFFIFAKFIYASIGCIKSLMCGLGVAEVALESERRSLENLGLIN